MKGALLAAVYRTATLAPLAALWFIVGRVDSLGI